KERAARWVGVSKDAWKEALIALTYEADLIGPDKVREHVGRALQRSGGGAGWQYEFKLARNSVVAALAADTAAADFADAYDRFHRLVRPVNEEFKAWRRHLMKVHAPSAVKYGSGKRYLKNACKMGLNLDGIQDARERQRKAAAHVLQG